MALTLFDANNCVESNIRERCITSLQEVIADNQPYLSYGYRGIDARCIWLGLDEHKSPGMIEEMISGEFMITKVGIDEAPAGPIDFPGYLF